MKAEPQKEVIEFQADDYRFLTFYMFVDRFGIPWMINCEGTRGS